MRRGLEPLFRAVVGHPVAVTMVFLAALVFGWVSYQRLPIELMPDIAYPTITVRTAYPGAAPQEVESQISRPVEEALATLDGLVSIESRSRAGSSDVLLGFNWGTDMSGAAQAIRESLQMAWLPLEADRPLILRYDPSLDPFLRLAVSATAEGSADATVDEERLFALRKLADTELKRTLEAVEGIAAVGVKGGLEREIRVEVREDWLAARRVSLAEVQNALSAENINVAGGSIIQGDVSYLIRTLNEYTSVEELQGITIRRSDGVLVPLSDVATVKAGHREREVISRLDSGEAVEIEVFKEADANVVDVASRVRTLLDGDGRPRQWGGTPGLRDNLPEGIRLTVLDNQAAFIEAAVTNLRDTALIGGLFAVSVLFLFLRDFRATAIIGTAIPMSVVIGFAPLYLQGISLNLMSLGGLALGVGMLVDNAVVVLESIQRYIEDGDSRTEAAIKGTSDVSAAVTSSTLTTVAVFLPISFVEGVAGELFGDLSVAVVSSLLASLAVALFAVPMLAALSLSSDSANRSTLLSGFDRRPDTTIGTYLMDVLGTAVRRTLDPVLDEFTSSFGWMRQRLALRFIVLPYLLLRAVIHLSLRATGTAGTLVLTVGAWLFYRVGARVIRPLSTLAHRAAAAFGRGYSLFDARYRSLLANAMARPGRVLSTAFTLFALSLVGASILGTELIPELHQGRFTAELALPVGTPLERTTVLTSRAERIASEVPGVAAVYSTVGVDARSDAGSDEGEHTARMRIQLVESSDFAAAEERAMEILRARLADQLPEIEVNMARPALFSTRTPVEVVLVGWDLTQLREIGDIAVEALSELPGLRDVQTSLAEGHPEIQIHYDRMRLHRLGLDAASVATRVRDKMQGVEATRIQQEEQRVNLVVQLVERQRGDLDDLKRININPELDPVIPLSAVADIEESIGPSEIRRIDQQRAVVISANLAAFDLGSAVSDIERALQDIDLPDGVHWTIAGQSQEMQSSLSSLQFALMLAIFLVYVIMASTFENVVHPFVILFSVPLAAVGAVFGLGLVGAPISVVVLIGLIVLAGVVVNNAIVLVDTINGLRQTGLDRDEAVQQASGLRLRPILITTATTVLGLTPLAMGFGAGAEMQGPLAITVIGGLLSSTLLTLVVIPMVYRVMNPAVPASEASSPADEVLA